MSLFETAGQSETSSSSIAESSFISLSMGNHFGIFGRLDFVLAVFFLGFMENAFAYSIGFLHRHGFGAGGRKKKLGFSEGLHEFESGIRSEFAEEEAIGRDVDDGEFGDDVVDNFNARERKRTFFQDFWFVVTGGVLHVDGDSLGAGDEVHGAAHPL